MHRGIALLFPLLFVGCVERMIEIRTEPPQAEVFLDGQRIGETPITHKYVHYGTRELTIVKKGYRSHRQLVELNAPWWQVFPFDLITDVLIPFTLTDKVDLNIQLEKEPPWQEAFRETLKRAEEARRKANPTEETP